MRAGQVYLEHYIHNELLCDAADFIDLEGLQLKPIYTFPGVKLNLQTVMSE